ncbi:geranylgeranyl pyrophosphate synthase [Longilinea arvoryzae]|uniref:Geranylgeranyl pyrophosphate synthase n=1 Tax=Longilinea arvoryzae TaxID=360412 RepID=A0A0S7BHS9_9CHLR|nr:polyprenyl synthetase family protein [Longilinea arvoryzae]GAP14644.1 geranylgeranyl pyrophosphate synthase [Longilinea arvoryzae]
MNTSELFFAPVTEDIRAIEALILSQANGYQADLKAALEHLLSSGGKRIRPTLTLIIGRMLGAEKRHLLTMAAAIELLHTATLVHDDLIDGSLLRRGIPTLNAQWSPGATVLTGDFLFAKAASLAARTESIPVIQLFSETLSIIVNGEISQMFDNRCRINRDEYYKRIYAKTASLFETSAASAAMLSPVDENVIHQLAQFGYNIGMAFQILDDILDFTADQATIGKPVGGDLRQGLVTLPTILYAEHHPGDAAIEMLVKGECVQKENQLNGLIQAIQSSEAPRLALAEAKSFVARGIESIRTQPDSIERNQLIELAEYIVDRKL